MDSIGATGQTWLLAGGFVFGWMIVVTVVKRMAFAAVRRLASRTENKFDDLILQAMDLPLQMVAYASGVLIVQNFFPQSLDSNFFTYLLYAFRAVCIVAAILFIDRLAQGLVRQAEGRVEILKTSGGFARGLVRAVILVLGGLVLLDTLGVSVTPIIASLGIGSLAVALALQPTLENFFSGIQLLVDKPVQVGHMVRLESGEEGTVHKIGWRSTWIGLPNNNTVVIPNKMLVNSRVTNYFYPNSEVGFAIPVGVSYDSDLERVERVVIDTARETVRETKVGAAGFDPFMRYYKFGDFSIDINVIFRAKDFSSTHVIRHDFVKRLHKRFQQEGIVIPFPTRTVVQAG